MDLLGKRRGVRRSGRYWDRTSWSVTMLAGVLLTGVGLYAYLSQAQGERVATTVLACYMEQTEAKTQEWSPYCDVRLVRAPQTRFDEVEVTRRYPSGTRLTLTLFRGDLSDASIDQRTGWFAAPGLLVLLGGWWLGLPPRNDPNYGRHARKARPV